MKIILDTELCKKQGYDVDLMLYLASFLCDTPITRETFEKARNKHYLTFNKPFDNIPFPPFVELNSTGEFVIEGALAESKLSGSEERFINLANALREIFPAGKKPGYAYTWRDSTSCIVDRLKKFILKYGDYSDERIIAATKEYVKSFNGDYRYMQLLKYFIWKNKVTAEEMVRGRLVGEVERQSQLAAYLEDTEEKSTKPEWDTTLK